MQENEREPREAGPEIMPMPSVEMRAERWPLIPALAEADERTRRFEGLDEETKNWLAILVDHPEAREDILGQLRKYKDEILDVTIDDYLRLLATIVEERGDDLTQQHAGLEEQTARDQKELSQYEGRIRLLIDFFRPHSETTPERSVVLLPARPDLAKTEGWALSANTVLYIQSHHENPDNADHEFLHAVINPITEKLPLTDEEGRHITATSSKRLIIDQQYGETPLFLLNETLIRTYVYRYAKGERPQTAHALHERIVHLDENTFAQALRQNNGRLQKELDTLGISSLTEFQSRWQEYHDRYVRDDLTAQAYALYESYDHEKEADNSLTFETYLQAHYRDLLLQTKDTPEGV